MDPASPANACHWSIPDVPELVLSPSLVSVSSSVKPSEVERLWEAFLIAPGLMVVAHCPLTLTLGPALSEVTQVGTTQCDRSSEGGMLTGDRRLTCLELKGRLPGGGDHWDPALHPFTQQVPSKSCARPGARFQGSELNRSQTPLMRGSHFRRRHRET